MSSKGEDFTIADDYTYLGELAGPSPVENPQEKPLYRHEFLEERLDDKNARHEKGRKARQDASRESWLDEASDRSETLQDSNLTEIAAPPPLEDRDESQTYEPQHDLESPPSSESSSKSHALRLRRKRASRFATELYTVSYLILFSILGTLARLGLQTLTVYPGAPIVNGSLWANFGGSLIMGFLSEDRKLFQERGHAEKPPSDKGFSSKSQEPVAPKKTHDAAKKTVPLYIGLATGFCGSFTSFSSFMRDAFLALSNDLPSPISHPSPTNTSKTSTVPRNGGYSFMAVLAVLIITPALCLAALQTGAHLALALEPLTPTLPFLLMRKFFDRTIVAISWLAWLGAILMTIFPPDRPWGPASKQSWADETWRGQALFALVFAPLGCLVRFYASLHLNKRMESLPLGTFAVNISGTLVLGMCFDLQHVGAGGKVGCQVLQGIMDGFCGCLTTVSTWVVELKGLRRRHAYRYGALSVGVAGAGLILIMGGLRWTKGFQEIVCEGKKVTN